MIASASRLALAALAPFALGLAACNSADETQDGSGDPVEAVAAPDGQQWSDIATVTDEGGYLIGNPDAPIHLVEFGALSCPHCAEFVSEAYESLRDDYVNSGRVSFEMRFYLLSAFDIPSTILATCSTPAATIPLADEFWANQASFFETAQQYGEEAFKRAGELPPGERMYEFARMFGMIDFFTARGISADQAKACLMDEARAEELAQNTRTQSEKYDITGTPSFLLNGSKIDAGTWPQVEAALQEAGAR